MAASLFDDSNTHAQSLEALADYLQAEAEDRNRALARQLHDDLGGSLIAAMMDVAWLTRHPSAPGTDPPARLHRIEGSLTTAIEITRRLVDELQPALLDSVGLFVAVGSHCRRVCERHGIEYSETVSGTAPDVDSETAMTVFRIAQGILQWLREDALATELHAFYQSEMETLTMRFMVRGVLRAAVPKQGILAPGLASIAMRLRKVKGTFNSEIGDGSVTVQVQIPVIASHPQVAA
jgi:signal transduction histidine kinase